METVRANGVDVAYRRVGDGPPLVLVHGAGDDGRVWQPQLADLSDEVHGRRLGRAGSGPLHGCACGLLIWGELTPAHRSVWHTSCSRRFPTPSSS